MSKCPYCRNEIDETSIACPECGRAVLSPLDIDQFPENGENVTPDSNETSGEKKKYRIRRIVLWGLLLLFVVLLITIAFLFPDYISSKEGWTTYSNLPDNWLSDMEIRMAGRVWDGPRNIIVFDGENWVPYESLPVEFTDSTGNTWNISGSGIKLFDGDAWTDYSNDYYVDYINAFALDPSGRAWVGTSFHGALLLSHNGWWVSYSRDNSGLYKKGVQEILFDSSGNIWFYHSQNSASKLTLEGDHLPDLFNIGKIKFVILLFACECLVAILFYNLWDMRLLCRIWIALFGLFLGLWVSGLVLDKLNWNEMSWIAGTVTIGIPFGLAMSILLENFYYRIKIGSIKGSFRIHGTSLILAIFIICVGIVVTGISTTYLLDNIWSDNLLWMDEATAFIFSLAAGFIPIKISFMLLPRKIMVS